MTNKNIALSEHDTQNGYVHLENDDHCDWEQPDGKPHGNLSFTRFTRPRETAPNRSSLLCGFMSFHPSQFMKI